MLSMTGYGHGESPLGKGTLSVELRAVNHRHLDTRVRLPSGLADHTSAVEEVLRKRARRGRIEASVHVEGAAVGLPTLDVAAARAAFEDLGRLRDELRPEEVVPLSLLSSVPDLFKMNGGPGKEEVRAALRYATEAACLALDEMRAREGSALADDLRHRLGRTREHIEEVKLRCPDAVESHRQRMRERLERLLAEVEVPLDLGRLEHEVALFADRSDVAEEVSRLGIHCDQFDELIASGGDSLGKKLGFLLQEMGREANTLGSKSHDVALARRVIELKADIERMREQIQNVL